MKIIFILILLLAYATAPAENNPSQIAQGTEAIINKSEFKHANIGIIVQSLDNKAILYQHNADMLFSPASSTKLFTAIAALKYLGPNYYFQTQILISQQSLHGHILSGNLYFKFTGDPTFTISDLQKMIKLLTQKGINTIHGNIVIDDTALTGSNWAPGVSWDTLPTHWAAPATAIVLNENYFDASLSSNNTVNIPATLKIKPILSGATISNQTIVKQAQAWECPLELNMNNENHYTLTGCLAPNINSLPLKIAYSNPRMALENTLTKLFLKEGITYSGKIIFAKAPTNNIETLAQHNSAPLKDIVKKMLKESDNLIAEILLKTLGQQYFNTAGTWFNGTEAVKAILAPTGVDFNKIHIADGAGLSRYNFISPKQFLNLLNYAYYRFSEKDNFYQALPIGHVDGTLKNRFRAQDEYKVHAKTGSMIGGISSLTGYVHTNQQHTLAFAILINNFYSVDRNKEVDALEDRIVEYLIENV